MGSIIRAVVFDHPAADESATRVTTIPGPEPGPGQVSIAVEYAGINFKDVMMRRGDPGYVGDWPVTPGLEVAGTIAELGSGVDDLAIGQRVVALTNTGGLAESALASASVVVPIPAGLSAATAAVVPGAFATAELLIHDFGRSRSGDTVVVSSASGAVGTAIASLARLVGGVTLIGIVGAPSRVAAAERAGYDRVMVRGPSLADEVRAVAAHGVDIVLDSQGTAWLESDLAILRPAGRIVLFGNAGGGAPDPLPAAAQLFARNAAIGGFSLGALSAAEPALVRDAMARVLDHLVAGRLRIEPIVLDGLGAASVAQQRLADGTGVGKYVVRVR